MNRGNVMITGCSPGGIGNALAREFHRQGYRVIATARSTETIQDLAELGIDTLALTVNSESSIQGFRRQFENLNAGGIHYLINNAGSNFTIPALDVELAEAKACFDTNFFAVVRLVQVFVPELIRAKGTIVMLGSLGAEIPYVFGSIYNASKAALRSYADSLRVELAPFDVKVVTLITGGVKSQLTRKIQRALPPGSLYLPIQKEFNARKVHSADVGMDVETYAKDVVRKLHPVRSFWPWSWFAAQTPSNHIWVGAKSTLVWLLTAGWRDHNLFDWYFTRKYNLGKLRERSSKLD